MARVTVMVWRGELVNYMHLGVMLIETCVTLIKISAVRLFIDLVIITTKV